jgi:hypothetical protein
MLFRLGSFCVTLIGPTCCTISPDDTNFQTPNCGFWSNLVRKRINHNHKGNTKKDTRSLAVLWLLSSVPCRNASNKRNQLCGTDYFDLCAAQTQSLLSCAAH